MKNKINIILEEKTLTSLAGNPYGQLVYKEQVDQKIDFNKKNIIIFPNEIKRVASSFIQGFTSKIYKELNGRKFDDIIEIQGDQNLILKFKSVLR